MARLPRFEQGRDVSGVSSFEGMLLAADALRQLKEEVEGRVTAYPIEPAPAGRSILMMGGAVAGGDNFNLVPERFTFTIDRRLNPEEDLDQEGLRVLVWVGSPHRQLMVGGAEKKIVFDKFHVAQHLSQAVDKVRRQEHRALRKSDDDRLAKSRPQASLMQRIDFDGKAAVVTGASGGLGRAIAVALGRAGARVGLVARSREGLEDTQQLIGQPRAHVYCTDLRDEQAIHQLGERVTADFGTVDMLVNCAGVWHDAGTRYHGPHLAETPIERIPEVLEVGVRAPLLLTRVLLPRMVRRGAGKILQISAAFGGPHDGVGWVHYYVANRALDAFTEALAAELRAHKIQVNAIAPVFVGTDAVRRFYSREMEREPALEPVDVAQVALFLLSSRADHISGQVIVVRSKDDQG